MIDEKAKLALVIEQLESERKRREEDAIEAGRAIRISLRPLTVGGGDTDKLVARARADKVAELQRGGETRQVLFDDDELAVITTGVPRFGRDDGWEPPGMGPADPANPLNIARLRAAKAEDHPVTALPITPRPVAATEPQHWTRITVQISGPDERSTGIISEGKFALVDGEIHVRDLWGNHLGVVEHKPGDDPAAVARKLLRQKTGEKWGAFYNAIPPRVH